VIFVYERILKNLKAVVGQLKKLQKPLDAAVQ
jgi:hypothetical protein